MKTFKEIDNIIAEMSKKDFDILNKADSYYYDIDSRVQRNARRRLKYNLEKQGLTLEEWFLWLED